MNQNPEQFARDNIDKQLLACGWVIQGKKQVNLSAGIGVAIREYQTDTGPADYILSRVHGFRRNPLNRSGCWQVTRSDCITCWHHGSHDKFAPMPYIDRVAVRQFGSLVKNTNEGGDLNNNQFNSYSTLKI